MGHPTNSNSNPKSANVNRRDFLSGVLTTSLLAGVGTPELWAAGEENGVPYRKLGRTGERVSMVGLGGYHIGMQSDEQESVRIIRAALDVERRRHTAKNALKHDKLCELAGHLEVQGGQ